MHPVHLFPAFLRFIIHTWGNAVLRRYINLFSFSACDEILSAACSGCTCLGLRFPPFPLLYKPLPSSSFLFWRLFLGESVTFQGCQIRRLIPLVREEKIVTLRMPWSFRVYWCPLRSDIVCSCFLCISAVISRNALSYFIFIFIFYIIALSLVRVAGRVPNWTGSRGDRVGHPLVSPSEGTGQLSSYRTVFLFSQSRISSSLFFAFVFNIFL